MEWVRCETLQELLQAKASMPGACIVAGNTELGIDMHIKGARPAALLDPAAVPQLQELTHSDGGLLVRVRAAARMASCDRSMAVTDAFLRVTGWPERRSVAL